MITFIQKYLKPGKTLKLGCFHKIRQNRDNNIEFTYIDNITQERIVYTRFNPDTGQIGIIDIDKKFQRKGLGKQTIKHIENEFKKIKLEEIWVACSSNHYYWSKLHEFQYRDPIHWSVNNCGYFKKINYNDE